MKVVAVYEAKTRLSQMLGEIERGEQFTITRRGTPVAYLSAIAPGANAVNQAALTQQQRVSAAFAALQLLCGGVTLDLPLRQAIGDGRD